MREQEQQFEPGRDPEATVIRPLFDEDAAEVARPVIPLDDRAMNEGMGAYVETGTAPPAYTRAWKRRNHPTIMLVLVALFAGAVVGVTGLYFYQRSRTADTAVKTAAPEQQQQAPATSSEAPPAATTTEAAQPSVVAESPAAAAEEVAAAPAASERERVRVNDGEGTARETERAAPARRPEAEEEEARPAVVKRGRKGDDDDDERADASSPTRPRVYDTQGPAPAGSAAERRAAREEDRLRRMRRERRRVRGEAYMVDSIRGIFEGGRNSPPR
ncbi:MAG TPA: hypothetical protein VF240_02580 [Pyrinomonadaceae bacterium]